MGIPRFKGKGALIAFNMDMKCKAFRTFMQCEAMKF